eukprot:955363-Amorphochlora_amoeboformis.AAC.1
MEGDVWLRRDSLETTPKTVALAPAWRQPDTDVYLTHNMSIPRASRRSLSRMLRSYTRVSQARRMIASLSKISRISAGPRSFTTPSSRSALSPFPDVLTL